MTLRDELLALRDRNGLIHADSAVDWAQSHPQSLLYAELAKGDDWDDQTAAEKWRIHRMRRIIEVHIIDAQGDRETISLRIDRGSGGGYRSLDTVIASPELRWRALQDAIYDAQRFADRFHWLRPELTDLLDAIATAAAEVPSEPPVVPPAPRLRRRRSSQSDEARL